jgi:hypothetical protein
MPDGSCPPIRFWDGYRQIADCSADPAAKHVDSANDTKRCYLSLDAPSEPYEPPLDTGKHEVTDHLAAGAEAITEVLNWFQDLVSVKLLCATRPPLVRTNLAEPISLPPTMNPLK